MGNSKYLLAIVWLSVLIGASASNSFQRVSASTDREACVTGLVRIQENPDSMDDEWFDTASDAVLCLFQSESDYQIQGQPCVTDLVQSKVDPDSGIVAAMDSVSDSIICLSQTRTGTPEREACVTDLVQMRADPNSDATVTMIEWVGTINDAIICVART